MILFLLISLAYAQVATIPQNTVSIGKTGATNKTLEFNLTKSGASTNPKIKWNNSSSKLQFSNDGTSFADFGSGSGSGISGNLLLNPNWAENTDNWTASAGTYTRETGAANVLPPNSASGSWDASASNDTLTSNATTITANDGLSGQNIAGSCAIKCATGTCSHTLELWDGTNVLNSVDITSSTSSFAYTSVNGVAPSSGTIALRLKANADEPIAYVSNCYLGRAEGFNLANISQASFVGSIAWAATTSCQWTTTSTSYANFADDAQCDDNARTVTGNVIDSSAGLRPEVQFSAKKGATYLIMATAAFRQTGTNTASFAFGDGSVVFGGSSAMVANQSIGTIQGTYTPSTSGTKTINIMGLAETSTTANLYSDVASRKLTISVYEFPSASSTVYNANTTPAWGSVYFEGTTSCNWAANNTSYTSFSANANCNNPTVKGNATSAGKIPGGTFTNLPAGNYLAVANGQFETGNTAGQSVSFRLYDGTNGVGGAQAYSNSANEFDRLTSVSGVFTYTSFQPSITIQMQALRSGSSSNYQINASGSNISFGITLIPLSQSLPAPQLVGSVFSGTNGKTRTEFVTFGGSTPWGSTCSSSPCTIWSSSGSSTSVTRTSAGIYNVVWASGVWKGNPSCTASVHNDSSGTSGFSVSIPRNLLTTTNTTAYYRASTSDVLADTATTISCMESQ